MIIKMPTMKLYILNTNLTVNRLYLSKFIEFQWFWIGIQVVRPLKGMSSLAQIYHAEQQTKVSPFT
jgi:hypothetical protein